MARPATKKPQVPAAKKSRGRPTVFSPELARQICDGLVNGKSLITICLDPAMPGRSSVLRWLTTNAEFRGQYARAKEAGIDVLAEEVLEIADDSANDVQRARLRCDARRWYVGKLAPKKYGEHIAVTGADGGAIAFETTMAEPMPPAEVAAAVKRLLDKAESELRLSPMKGASARKRAKRIIESGGLLPPALYAALYTAGKSDE